MHTVNTFLNYLFFCFINSTTAALGTQRMHESVFGMSLIIFDFSSVMKSAIRVMNKLQPKSANGSVTCFCTDTSAFYTRCALHNQASIG
jgi:hypothetical protein